MVIGMYRIYTVILIILLHCHVGTDGEELSKIQKVKLIRNEQREGTLKKFLVI